MRRNFHSGLGDAMMKVNWVWEIKKIGINLFYFIYFVLLILLIHFYVQNNFFYSILIKYRSIPEKVSFFSEKKIISISAGFKHTLVCVEDEGTYGFGGNKRFCLGDASK